MKKNLSTLNNVDKSLLELQILNIKILVHNLSKNVVEIQTNATELNTAITKLVDATNGNLTGYIQELSLKVAGKYYNDEKNTSVWNKYVSCLFSNNIGILLNLYQECYTLALKSESIVTRKIVLNFKDFNKVIKYFNELKLKSIEFPTVENEKLHPELQALESLSFKSVENQL